MIPVFVERFDAKRGELRGAFKQKHPESYADIVKAVIEAVTTDEYGGLAPDPERIHQIDDGDYQGTLLFVIAEKGYQPSKYYAVYVGYGSCSVCDTLEAIRDYSGDPVTDQQADDYMTLALHVMQGLKEIE